MRTVETSCAVKGFTLVEMIAVIVLLSILAVLGGQFVMESTKSYQSTQTRSRLVNTGRQADERMSRQLRDALPNSVRVINVVAGAVCVEFMPIAGGGNYITAVADTVNGVTASSTINVSPHTVDFGTAKYVSIGATVDTEIYGASPGSLATLNSRTAVQLTLSAAKTWARNSVSQRFYLLDSPQAFCMVSNQLRFYSNQDVTSATIDLTSGYEILADNITASTPFALTAGSENKNVNVLINIAFAKNNESIAFNHSVMIRNVP